MGLFFPITILVNIFTNVYTEKEHDATTAWDQTPVKKPLREVNICSFHHFQNFNQTMLYWQLLELEASKLWSVEIKICVSSLLFFYMASIIEGGVTKRAPHNPWGRH